LEKIFEKEENAKKKLETAKLKNYWLNRILGKRSDLK